MNMRNRILIASCASLLLSSLAGADVIEAQWTAPFDFRYRVAHMPDFDQRRNTLPELGGMFCAPTSATNLFAYAANHGFPAVFPGAGPWQSQSMYANATSAITVMGLIMGTSPTEGTAGGSENGYLAFASASGLLARKHEYLTGSTVPTMPKMAKLGTQGWIVAFAYGRYDIVQFRGEKWLNRDKGHVITLTGAKHGSGGGQFRARDPATDSDDLDTQSTFSDRLGSWTQQQWNIYGSAGTDRWVTVLNPGSSLRVAVVDSMHAIRPRFGFSFLPTGSDPNHPAIKLHDPSPFIGSVNLIPSELQLPSGHHLVDMAFHPDMTELLVLLKSGSDPAKLSVLDPIANSIVQLPNDPLDLQRIAVSRKGPIFAFDTGGKLYRLDHNDGSMLNALSSLPPPTALAADDASDSVWILSVVQRRLVRFAETLGTAQTNWFIPAGIPMAGDGSVTVNPVSGKPYFCTAGSNSIYGVEQIAGGPLAIETISLPGITNPRALQFGPTGELMVVCDGSVRVLRFVAGAGWQIDTADPFHGIEARAPFIILPSRSNFEVALHSGPAWLNLPEEELELIGEEVLDCLGDLNGDEIVDGDDLGTLLGLWGTSRQLGDLNQDGIVDGNDLGTLLGYWGICPD